MSRRRVVRVVAMREVRQRIRSRSWAIATVVLTLAILAAIIVPTLVPDSRPHFDVGVVDGSNALRQALPALESTVGGDVTVREVPSAAAARAQLRDGTLDLVVVPAAAEMLVRKEPDDDSGLARLVSAAQFVAGLDREGIDPARAARAVNQGYAVHPLEAKHEDENQRRVAATFGVILLFIVLITYGQWISTGVIEEKSNRIVELLLPAVPAHDLLTGKVLGISMVAFAQFGTVAVTGLVASFAVGKDLPSATPWIIVTALACFLAGYAFYAALFAGAGALVSRVEDAGSAAVPITSLLTASYLIGLSAPPDSTLVRVLSFFPPSAPMTMLPRVAVGDATWWEAVLALGLTLAAAAFAMRGSARLYRGGLLRRGPKVKLREAWRATS